MSTRQRLIDVAAKLFAERGFHGVSIRDITSAAEANLGAVTYHFGPKENLFTQVILTKSEPMQKLKYQVGYAQLAPDEKLRKIMEALAMEVLHDNPDLKVMFVDLVAGGDHLPEGVVEAIKRDHGIFCDIIQEGIDAGVFRKCDVKHAAWVFHGLLASYVMLQPAIRPGSRRGAYPRKAVKEIVETSMDVFLDGIRKR